MINEPNTHAEGELQPPFRKRLVRALPIIAVLLVVTWIFGHTGILHRIETVVSDAKMRFTSPVDSVVAIVMIDDEDYRELFRGTSPLDPRELNTLLSAIARGKPAVIGVDIDTSDRRFAFSPLPRADVTKMVWERELEQVPEEGTETAAVRTRDVLGGRQDFDPKLYSTGLSLLIDSPEDQVTRHYRRYVATRDGLLPSFPTAISMAYHSIQQSPSSEDRVIGYAGNRDGSHRLHLNARSLLELSAGWPASSPIRDKIVLLGGSYLGQDRHETPLGQMTGLEIMANAVETESSGGGERPPSRAISFLLELFEAFVLIVLFHTLRFPLALGSSVILIPVMALLCSFLAYGNGSHFLEFSIVLLGLLLFELYEHFRRKAIPEVFENLAGTGPS